MKQDSKIILILLIAALLSSGIYFFLKARQNDNPMQIENQFIEQPTEIREDDNPQPTLIPDGEEAGDPTLEAQPSISENSDLKTIEQELEETEILEEDFSDL